MNKQPGFTLLELVLVISIVGIITALISIRFSNANYWKEEGEVRKLSELLEFLYHQAAIDGYYYRINFGFEDQNDSYQIGILGDEDFEDKQEITFGSDTTNRFGSGNDDDENSSGAGAIDTTTGFSSGVGILTQELAYFLQPTRGRSQTMLPPPDMPSMEAPIVLPDNIRILDVRTPRGLILNQPGESAWLDFSPRGFSEFGVIHLQLGEERQVTILINPFTGLTSVFREYRDFEWIWGKDRGTS